MIMERNANNEADLLPCKFCGSRPIRKVGEVANNVLSVFCPECASVGFHYHVRFGCLADRDWETSQPHC